MNKCMISTPVKFSNEKVSHVRGKSASKIVILNKSDYVCILMILHFVILKLCSKILLLKSSKTVITTSVAFLMLFLDPKHINIGIHLFST